MSNKAEMLRPPWIKDHYTLEHAARVAHFKGYTLRSEWHPLFGLRVIAVPKKLEELK
jgi:hypothetical protein